MASEPILDIQALLATIAGDNPAGSSVPFMLRQQFEELRKEIDPADFDEDDPTRPTELKKADWVGISRLAQATLTETSKDLLVVARLTEASTKEHGFVGLRDGLELFLKLIQEAWDRLQPTIEEESDLEVRAAPFEWLDDPDRGARFPNTIRLTPMVQGEEGPCCWFDWKQAQSGQGKVSGADFDKAVQRTSREHCQDLVDDLTQSWNLLEELAQELNTKMGQYAPGLSSIRQAIADCRALAQQILQRKGPDSNAVLDEESNSLELEGDGTIESGNESGLDSSGIGARSVALHVASREQVYRQLNEAAGMLQKLEPHSPIPYLLHRAVELGALPFPELMKALIRDSDVLESMNRELGIKESENDD